ncbi:hypothetical protein LDG_6283 [Legionella drancourtii LLAP12]|uniref:Uncharacterized protein n=1 Tax=Legionella drancourtii LLAP12 TaxID=658187 RepID=G9EM22_9GAMM|nr:hypothetical protein LDG_6283 [Legionella drancourtii LLAP12]
MAKSTLIFKIRNSLFFLAFASTQQCRAGMTECLNLDVRIK